MAFMAIIMGLGLLFYMLFGFRSGPAGSSGRDFGFRIPGSRSRGLGSRVWE